MANAVQNYAIKELNKLKNCKAIPITVSIYMERGTLDIIACYKGRFLTFEVKTGSDTISDIQKIRINEWAEAGALLGVLECKKDVDNLIIQLLKF